MMIAAFLGIIYISQNKATKDKLLSAAKKVKDFCPKNPHYSCPPRKCKRSKKQED